MWNGNAPTHHLEPKQIRFIEEYMIDLSPSNAAKRAGYKQPQAYGAELMKKPWIKEEIDKRMQEKSKELKLSEAFVVEGLVELAQRCMQQIKPITRGNGEPVLDDDGNIVFRFDSAGAAKAYELLGKHLGMFKDKVDVRAEVLTNEQCDAAVKAFMMGKQV